MVALSAKFAFVLLVPLAAWAITAFYQREEYIKSSTLAAITRTADQTAEILEMNKEFQLAFDTLLTTCGKEGQAAVNLCLADYVTRLIRINELVSEFSWRSSALPMPDEAQSAQRAWQDMWWGTATEQGVGGRLKHNLHAWAESRELLECEAVDFMDSKCGGDLQVILGPFRSQTNKLMCAVSLALRRYALAMYGSLPSSAATRALEDNLTAHLEDSYCGSLFKPRSGKP